MTHDNHRFSPPCLNGATLTGEAAPPGAPLKVHSLRLTASPATARIVVADDHQLTAELLQYYLMGEFATSTLGTPPLFFDKAQDALLECCRGGADLLVTDVCLPDMAPLDMLSALAQQSPGTRVLLFSRWNHPAICSSFIKAGVHGLIFKNDSLLHLGRAITTILNGGRYFSPAIEQATFEKLLCGIDCLTEREQSALCYIARGQSTKEMASSMAITPKTAEKYRERLMSKLNLHDAVQLTLFAIRTGLVPLGLERETATACRA